MRRDKTEVSVDKDDTTQWVMLATLVVLVVVKCLIWSYRGL